MSATGCTDPGLSILIVEDDAMVREVTVLMLADAGHTVHEAADGAAAMLFLTTHGPVDLLITDINMPEMDGLELGREAGQRWPGMPVLLVSGRPQPPGLKEFMAKPFGWDALIRAVDRLTPSSRNKVPGQPEVSEI